jgi:hypothetical protein
MALPININDILHGRTVEWERLEFKAGWNPEKVLHTLCAFANDFHNLGGGYVVIGVAEEDGRPVLPPVGIEPGALDRIQKELLNLGNRLQPSYCVFRSWNHALSEIGTSWYCALPAARAGPTRLRNRWRRRAGRTASVDFVGCIGRGETGGQTLS